MPRGVKVEVLSRGVRELLTSQGVEADMAARAERAASQARASAPVKSGAYRDSIEVVTELHNDRVVAHVMANVPYALRVEADTGTLARSLDAAGG